MSPCGCSSATRSSSACTERRTSGVGLWMRAMTCGMTASQVSTAMASTPSRTAASTSGDGPYLNHSVSRRRMSCSACSRPSAIEREKPRTAGTTYLAPSFCATTSKLIIAHACHAL